MFPVLFKYFAGRRTVCPWCSPLMARSIALLGASLLAASLGVLLAASLGGILLAASFGVLLAASLGVLLAASFGVLLAAFLLVTALAFTFLLRFLGVEAQAHHGYGSH